MDRLEDTIHQCWCARNLSTKQSTVSSPPTSLRRHSQTKDWSCGIACQSSPSHPSRLFGPRPHREIEIKILLINLQKVRQNILKHIQYQMLRHFPRLPCYTNQDDPAFLKKRPMNDSSATPTKSLDSLCTTSPPSHSDIWETYESPQYITPGGLQDMWEESQRKV